MGGSQSRLGKRAIAMTVYQDGNRPLFNRLERLLGFHNRLGAGREALERQLA